VNNDCRPHLAGKEKAGSLDKVGNLEKTIFCFGIVMPCLLLISISFGESLEPSEADKQEYKQDMARIRALKKSFKPGRVNDLEEYEKFADEIQIKWSRRNKGYYARLMLEICGPLSSGTFEDDRRYDLARKYALSVLADANDIPLTTELELTGHVMTSKYTCNAPKGEDFAQLECRLGPRGRSEL